MSTEAPRKCCWCEGIIRVSESEQMCQKCLEECWGLVDLNGPFEKRLRDQRDVLGWRWRKSERLRFQLLFAFVCQGLVCLLLMVLLMMKK